MKPTITLVLFFLFFLSLSCITVSSQTISGNETDITQQFNDTPPIDPMDLANWKPLYSVLTDEITTVAVVGNPKIDWSQENHDEAFDVPVPDGEFASTVYMVFVCDQYRYVGLKEFGFINREGIIESYTFGEDGKFHRSLHHTQKLC